ncbi:MFS transporter [Cordyceps fumosorosea ARSEF 2679]|uniref:MFS transporter n=1 Tax=Cordyceps fumosorosea (strain ARSEF 2679) TaxID=1081104 RepID=A0A168BNG4_CORFA|nr:MFS transporter [Cordyceps fumosorosea ARSEF 2679]OAA70343.1 MFS transporter [Cordyceps fumosorosea ARSEF 2679]
MTVTSRAVLKRRTSSSGSFHAGAPIPGVMGGRRSSVHRYQTFPTEPPPGTPIAAIPGSPPPASPSSSRPSSVASLPSSPTSSENDDYDRGQTGEEEGGGGTPLPVRQLLLLAYLSLCEQTALNSLAPYLPEMVASMPGLDSGRTGFYIGVVASAFALAQLSTNFAWGYSSDLIGRKPVLLAGTLALAACFGAFGLCTQYWQVVLVQVLMGMLNGNAACVPTVLGEVTDRSNQSRAFAYLPIIYSLGGITGPAVGGFLVGRLAPDTFPYLAPNLVSAAMLVTGFLAVLLWFEETLDEDARGPGKPKWLRRLASWFGKKDEPNRRHSWSARWPTRDQQRQPLLDVDSASSSDEAEVDVPNGYDDDNKPEQAEPGIWKEIVNPTTVLLLATYLVFQLSNISFNSLYPVFAAAPAPTGRELGPGKIGAFLSAAGVTTIAFQAFVYRHLRSRMGSLGTYRYALFGLAVSMILMPWVGYADDEPLFGVGSGELWLYAELCAVLIFKNICAVGGLSSVMLLITNSAPSHASLGTLNGLAQTLSALGRSVGPVVSGGLFTLSVGIRPKGEALAWTVFGGLALLGFVAALFVRGDGLESEEWEEEHGSSPEAEEA